MDFAACAFRGLGRRRRVVSFGRACDFEVDALRDAPPTLPARAARGLRGPRTIRLPREPANSEWEQSIPRTEGLRHPVTYRALRSAA
jgi:hypothetical protein